MTNSDHMHISGTEPSSVILSQTKLFQELQKVANVSSSPLRLVTQILHTTTFTEPIPFINKQNVSKERINLQIASCDFRY